LLALAVVAGANAQDFKKMGKKAVELVPNGWKVEECKGDLNRDGFPDLVVLATPNDADKLIIREDDGYVFDCNAPVLAIYWGVGGGYYQLYKRYDDIVPHREDEDLDVQVEATVTERGCLRFQTKTWASAGSSDTGGNVSVYRYQNGDFFRIGFETDYFSRMSGDGLKISVNFSTGKMQKITYNEFDEDAEKQETWSDIPKNPLVKLGEKSVDACPEWIEN